MSAPRDLFNASGLSFYRWACAAGWPSITLTEAHKAWEGDEDPSEYRGAERKIRPVPVWSKGEVLTLDKWLELAEWLHHTLGEQGLLDDRWFVDTDQGEVVRVDFPDDDVDPFEDDDMAAAFVAKELSERIGFDASLLDVVRVNRTAYRRRVGDAVTEEQHAASERQWAEDYNDGCRLPRIGIYQRPDGRWAAGYLDDGGCDQLTEPRETRGEAEADREKLRSRHS